MAHLAGEDLAPIFGGTKTWEEMGDVRAGDEMRNLQRTDEEPATHAGMFVLFTRLMPL